MLLKVARHTEMQLIMRKGVCDKGFCPSAEVEGRSHLAWAELQVMLQGTLLSESQGWVIEIDEDFHKASNN